MLFSHVPIIYVHSKNRTWGFGVPKVRATKQLFPVEYRRGGSCDRASGGCRVDESSLPVRSQGWEGSRDRAEWQLRRVRRKARVGVGLRFPSPLTAGAPIRSRHGGSGVRAASPTCLYLPGPEADLQQVQEDGPAHPPTTPHHGE